MAAPIGDPQTVPSPPLALATPPMTTAAITSVSWIFQCLICTAQISCHDDPAERKVLGDNVLAKTFQFISL